MNPAARIDFRGGAMKFESLEANESLTRVALIGMLDLAGVGQVERDFTAATVDRGVPTIVDLSQLTFLASMGMQLLLRCAKALRDRGAALVLLNPTKDVELALAAAQLTRFLPVAHDEFDALRVLGLK
jgi:anti-anti-sigma factor